METKLCECGCGNPAPIATRNRTRAGWIKGQPLRFIFGHSARVASITHGMTSTPEYRAWDHARRRCTNPKDKDWPNYGGRGIEFRFASFEEFFAELGSRPTPEHSLDRKDNNGHYEPGNVCWATKSEQERNKRPRSAEHNAAISAALTARYQKAA